MQLFKDYTRTHDTNGNIQMSRMKSQIQTETIHTDTYLLAAGLLPMQLATSKDFKQQKINAVQSAVLVLKTNWCWIG